MQTRETDAYALKFFSNCSFELRINDQWQWVFVVNAALSFPIEKVKCFVQHVFSNEGRSGWWASFWLSDLSQVGKYFSSLKTRRYLILVGTELVESRCEVVELAEKRSFRGSCAADYKFLFSTPHLKRGHTLIAERLYYRCSGKRVRRRKCTETQNGYNCQISIQLIAFKALHSVRAVNIIVR